MIIYLYVKTHIITGLKYLGKTTAADPHKYAGSGTDWKIHLKEFGANYSTEIIRECHSNQDLSHWGRYYSKLWDVAASKDWANRIPETGGGSSHTSERRELFRQQQLGKKKPPRTEEHKKKLGDSLRGRARPALSAKLTGRKLSEEHIKNSYNSIKNWYKNNPELAHQKAINTWTSRYKKDYSKYETAIRLIAKNATNKEIQAAIKIDYATIIKLRTRTHRIFTVFPEFIQLMTAEVL